MGIDIGGSKTLMGLFSDAGELVQTEKFATQDDYPVFLQDLQATYNKFPHDTVQACGVAVPGRLDRQTGIVLSCGNLSWSNLPIQKDIAHIVQIPTRIENDARLAALSEAKLIAKDYKKVLYITISTGIGIGVITNGIIDPGLADSEAGSMLSLHDGALTRWEQFASGKAIRERYGKLASDIEAGSPEWQPICEDLAPGIFNIVAMVQPQVIILGGGVGERLPRYQDVLTATLKHYETPMVPIPPLLPVQHAAQAVLYGCYELARIHHATTDQ